MPLVDNLVIPLDNHIWMLYTVIIADSQANVKVNQRYSEKRRRSTGERGIP